MREIKFRAWDNKYQKWVEPRFIEIQGDGTVWITRSAANGDEIESEETPDVVLEQLTGLHDREVNEIYDGDIVEDQHGFVKTIGWYNTAFRIRDHDVSYALHEYAICGVPGIADNLHKIGNIHENKELLL